MSVLSILSSSLLTPNFNCLFLSYLSFNILLFSVLKYTKRAVIRVIYQERFLRKDKNRKPLYSPVCPAPMTPPPWPHTLPVRTHSSVWQKVHWTLKLKCCCTHWKGQRFLTIQHGVDCDTSINVGRKNRVFDLHWGHPTGSDAQQIRVQSPFEWLTKQSVGMMTPVLLGTN